MMASMPPNVANELRLRKLISKEINIILAKTIATIQKNTTDPNLNLGVLLKGEFMDAINRMVDEKLNLHMQTIRLFDKKFNLIDNPTSSGSKADGKSGNGKIEAKDYSKHKVSELRITVLNDTFYIEGIPSNLKFEQLLLDGNVAYKFSLVNENEETENFNADELNKLLNNELNMSNISRSNSEDASNGTSNDIPSSSDSKSIGGNNNSGSESWQMTSMDRIIETPSDRKNRYLRGKCKCNCTSNCTVRKIRNKSNDSSKTVEMSENVSFDEPVETSNMMDETNATLEKESINDEVQQRKSKRIEENKIHPKPVRDSPVRTINHVKTGRVGRPRKNQGIINPAETNTEQTPESADSRPMQRFKFVKRIPNLPNQHIIPVPDIQNLDKPIPAEAHDHEIPILDKTSLAVTKMIDFQSSLAICPTVSKLRNFNSLHMTTCLESQKCNLQALNESVDVSKRTGRLRKPRKPWPKKLRPTLTQIAELYSSTSTQADALTVAKQETLLKELRKMTSRGGTTTKKAFITASKLADLNGIVL
uniref:Dentin sialophosphoprotein-like n=1 Tax=Rhabditophanes sp. KR3021 TaxID=114890 RepID=A0AC35TTF8_9BILA